MTITTDPIPLYGLSLLEGQNINVGPYAWKTEVDLGVLGIPYQLVGRTFAQIRGEFEKETGNPKVSVPTIKVGDEWVTDSFAIAEWLEAKYGTPERSLFAGSEAGKAFARFINLWVDTELFKDIVPLFAPWLYQAQNAESSAWFLKQKLGNDQKTIDHLIAVNADPAWVETQSAAVRAKLGLIEKQLAANAEAGKGRFLAGTDYPTHADASLYGWVGAAAAVRPHDLVATIWKHESLPLVSGWVDAVEKVAGVKPAYPY